MKDKMEKMMGKKKGLSDNEKKAKLSVVKDMQKMASDAMGDKIRGMKKVSVMSNDKEGLKEGLEKAKDLLNFHEDKDKGPDALGEASDDADHLTNQLEENNPESSEHYGDADAESDEHEGSCHCNDCIDKKVADLQSKRK